MKTNELATIATRVLGIYLLIQAAVLLPTLVQRLYDPMARADQYFNYRVYAGGVVLPFLVFVLTGIAALRFDASLGKLLAPKGNETISVGEGTPSQYMAVALFLLGIALFAFAFPGLINAATYWALLKKSMGKAATEMPAGVIAGVVATATQAISGLILIVQARRISELWREKEQ